MEQKRTRCVWTSKKGKKVNIKSFQKSLSLLKSNFFDASKGNTHAGAHICTRIYICIRNSTPETSEIKDFIWKVIFNSYYETFYLKKWIKYIFKYFFEIDFLIEGGGDH